jgi:hypothetical protein
MTVRYQIVESMMWRPPAGVDPETVRFHIDEWTTDGRPLDFDDVVERRADVIAEWHESDPHESDTCVETCCVQEFAGARSGTVHRITIPIVGRAGR